MSSKRKYEKTVPKVLAYLAFRKANKWELAKRLDKSYSNIHKTSSQLLKRGLIRVVETKPSIKNKKVEVEFYSSTLKGLFAVLKFPSLWKNIDKIADYHKDKLDLFREWKNFTQAEKEVIKKEFESLYKRKLFSLDHVAMICPEDEFMVYIDGYFVAVEVQYFKGELYDIVKRNPNLRKKHLLKLHEELDRLKIDIDAVERGIVELEQ